MVVLGVIVAAAAGTLLRAVLRDRGDGGRPWGTLAANVIGSLVLGVLVGADVAGGVITVVGTGALGAVTTFSGVAATADRNGMTVAAFGLPLLSAAAGVVAGATVL